MSAINNRILIGKVEAKESTFKVDGKKYNLTEKFAGVLQKLDLDGRTAMFYLNKDGEIDSVQLNGTITVNGVETPSRKEEGKTYRATYMGVMGTACNLKDGKPFRFSVATRNKENETTYIPCKAWDELAERARVELAVPDGAKKPRVWVLCRVSKYNDRKQYTVEDFGIIFD